MKICNQKGGFSALTKDEFCQLATLLIKAGYSVTPAMMLPPGKASGKVPCLEVTEKGGRTDAPEQK